MSSTEFQVPIKDWKGVNFREAVGRIEDNELISCENFNLGRTGELSKRTGFVTINPTSLLGSNSVRLLGMFITSGISQILARAGTTIYKSDNGSTWTALSGSWGDVQHGVQWLDKYYMARSDGTVLEYNGTTITAITGSPSGTWILAYRNRLFVFNSLAVSSLRNRLYYCDPLTPTTWPATGYVDINSGDGDFLVGGAIVADDIMLFKTDAIYVQNAKATSPLAWSTRVFNTQVGCVSKDSIREINNQIYFESRTSVYKTDGNNLEDIGLNLEPIFQARTISTNTINRDSAAYWENKYILVTTQEINNDTWSGYSGLEWQIFGQRTWANVTTPRTFVYHEKNEGWTEWVMGDSSINLFTFLEVPTVSPVRGLYCGNGNASGKIFNFGKAIYLDNASQYRCKVETKEYDIETPSRLKRGKWVAVESEGSGLWEFLNTTNVGTEITDSKVIVESTRRAVKVKGPQYFRVWRFRITATTSDALVVYGVTLHGHIKRTLIGAA